MNIVAGIDPSITNTGIVLLNATTGKLQGSFDTKDYIKKHKAKGLYRYTRLQNLANIVINILSQYHIQSIYYEDYSFDSQNLAYTTGELGGVLRTALIINFNTLTLIEPTKLKKFATGHGNSGKEAIINLAMQETKLNSAAITSDICDAYFLAKMAFYNVNAKKALQLETTKNLTRLRLEIAKKSEENLLC